jgi:hypothetical protein
MEARKSVISVVFMGFGRIIRKDYLKQIFRASRLIEENNNGRTRKSKEETMKGVVER